MNDSERIFARVFRDVEASFSLRFNADQHESVHDFDILDGARRVVGAVEVTSAHDSAMTRAYAAIRQTAEDGKPFWAAVRCRRSWHAHLSPHAKVKTFRKRGDEYLAAVEAAGLERFSAHDYDDMQHPSVAAVVHDLGVKTAAAFTARDGVFIALSPPIQVTWVSPDALLPVVQAIAAREDNARKLASAPGARRVLAIEVSWHLASASAAMRDDRLPSSAPQLAVGMTELWLFACVFRDVRVLRWNDHRWQRDTLPGVVAELFAVESA